MNAIVRLLRRIASAAEGVAVRLETAECTGVAASWCPIHGDCICSPIDIECACCGAGSNKVITKGTRFMCHRCGLEWPCDEGRACFELTDKNSPYCPLHRVDSKHAIGATS